MVELTYKCAVRTNIQKNWPPKPLRCFLWRWTSSANPTLWAHIAHQYYSAQRWCNVCCEMDSTLINVQICLIHFKARPLICVSCNKLSVQHNFLSHWRTVCDWEMRSELKLKANTVMPTHSSSLNTYIHPDELVTHTQTHIGCMYKAKGNSAKVWVWWWEYKNQKPVWHTGTQVVKYCQDPIF